MNSDNWTNRIKLNLSKLCDLTSTSDRFLDTCVERDVLTKDERNLINTEAISYKQNSKFYTYILKKDKRTLNILIVIMQEKDTRQSDDVLNILKDPVVTATCQTVEQSQNSQESQICITSPSELPNNDERSTCNQQKLDQNFPSTPEETQTLIQHFTTDLSGYTEFPCSNVIELTLMFNNTNQKISKEWLAGCMEKLPRFVNIIGKPTPDQFYELLSSKLKTKIHGVVTVQYIKCPKFQLNSSSVLKGTIIPQLMTDLSSYTDFSCSSVIELTLEFNNANHKMSQEWLDGCNGKLPKYLIIIGSPTTEQLYELLSSKLKTKICGDIVLLYK